MPVAAWLVTAAIIGSIALLAIGALLCFPAPRRHAAALRRP
jgi:hypothetical protein